MRTPAVREETGTLRADIAAFLPEALNWEHELPASAASAFGVSGAMREIAELKETGSAPVVQAWRQEAVAEEGQEDPALFADSEGHEAANRR